MGSRLVWKNNCKMNSFPDIPVGVKTSDGSHLTFYPKDREGAKEVLRALTTGGYVVLKNATSYEISFNYTEAHMLRNPVCPSHIIIVQN